MICAAGLGTVSEILDWENGWDPPTLHAMLAVAVEIEVRRSQAIHQATHAAVLAAFDPKAGKAYHEALAGAMKGVRVAQGKKEKGHADQFLASLLKAAKKDG